MVLHSPDGSQTCYVAENDLEISHLHLPRTRVQTGTAVLNFSLPFFFLIFKTLLVSCACDGGQGVGHVDVWKLEEDSAESVPTLP